MKIGRGRIVAAGLLGGLVVLLWVIISTSLVPLSGDIPEQIPGDQGIHSTLKEKLQKPGIYYVPGHPEDGRDTYPDYGNEPLFFIFYAGTTPDTFTAQMVCELCCIFIAAIIAAWMLSVSAESILSRYPRRVLFVAALGLFLAVFGDLFSQKPMDRMALSSINHLVTWTLAGLAIAGLVKPAREI